MDLFDFSAGNRDRRPLAERMRPRGLDDFFGQEELLGPDKVLRRAIEEDRIFSMLFWGPPGTGKTTLARLVAQKTRSHFVPFSAVSVGVKEIKAVAQEAAEDLKYKGVRTILFLDEIHRFNKSQQDYLLPHVEDGSVVLIGATTENPSFEVNAALLSRLRVFVFTMLSEEHIKGILQRARTDVKDGLGHRNLAATSEAEDVMARLSGGDARTALNILEVAAQLTEQRGHDTIRPDAVHEAAQKRQLLYDKAGEEHFNLISAFHKSLRDGDADAGLYWMGRMLEGGEDPLYIARRLVRFASEDVGLAAPDALIQSVAAFQSCQMIGLPECALALAQVVVFLAAAPKSNALYTAYKSVQKEIKESGHPPVPFHIRNAPTRLMKEMGYGKGYKYAHDYPDAQVEQDHLPEEIRGTRFYYPTDRGFERRIRDLLGVSEDRDREEG